MKPRNVICPELIEKHSIPEPMSGCWLWLLTTNTSGYGMISIDGWPAVASRVSWIAHNGAVPDGFHVRHKCDTPLCVNPQHLCVGTHQDNMTDKIVRGRQSRGAAHSAIMLRVSNYGESNHMARLTFENVRLIRTTPRNDREWSVELGLPISSIRAARTGLSWKNHPTPPWVKPR